MDPKELVKALERLGGEAELWELRESMTGASPEDLGRLLWDLRARGVLELRPRRRPTFLGYLAGPEGWWFWLYVFGVVLGVAAAFMMPRSPPEVELVRVFMGAPSLFYLPGYGLLKALYPERRWGSPEEAALSISLSLAILPLVGLALVYTPIGITVTSVEASLSALNLVLGLSAAYRRMPYDLGLSGAPESRARGVS